MESDVEKHVEFGVHMYSEKSRRSSQTGKDTPLYGDINVVLPMARGIKSLATPICRPPPHHRVPSSGSQTLHRTSNLLCSSQERSHPLNPDHSSSTDIYFVDYLDKPL